MYKEILQIKSIDEIESILFKESDDFFINKEYKSVENKNQIKSLGARYLIKNSILRFLGLNNEYHDIEIENEETGKPLVSFKGTIKEIMDKKELNNIQISISHSRNFVATLVIFENV